MISSMVDQIARTVLYEGYILYPYRASALKNQQRWNFGVLYPPEWAARQTGSDRAYFQLEIPAQCSSGAHIDVSVRFLQLVRREDGEREWQEAVEQQIGMASLAVTDLVAQPHVESVCFAAGCDTTGDIIRRRYLLEARAEIAAAQILPGVVRITLRVINTGTALASTRDDALMHSLVSAHALLKIQDGAFVSLTDPPDNLRDVAAACQNTGVWPVLVGDPAQRDTVLGSPIILYDYPQVAPESKGDLFDGTEIDEILILRILTLSDREKEEVRRSDERARRILERLESAPPEHLLELHGKIRDMSPTEAWPHSAFKKGDRVRLRPRKRADIFDTLLEGKIAIIEAVEQDFENHTHFAVVIEDDPGRDLGEMRQIGHRFFFSPEEVEAV